MTFKYHKDSQQIVTLTMDMPARTVNVINEGFKAGLKDTLARLEAETDLAGVILTSAKKTFVVGVDLDEMFDLRDPALAFERSEHFKAVLRRLETIGIPVVAALNGTALGGGLEIALACHYRVAINNPNTKYGFPAVSFGLFPGGGGIVRLTRMIGLQAAMSYLMEGNQVNVYQAQNAGLIDVLAPDQRTLLSKAKAWILANPNGVQPWDKPDYQMPGGNAHSPAVRPMLSIAPAILKQKTYGNYPAPEAILSAAVEGSTLDFSTASRIESRYFAKVVTSRAAQNMVRALWFQKNEVMKAANRPVDIPQTVTNKVGILGAGMMGHGIAYVTAQAGLDAIILDVSPEKAEAGKAKIAALLDERVAQGRTSAQERDSILNRVQPTTNFGDLAGCDLIIEAVFEDQDLKAAILQEAESHLTDEGILASNTSTIPITSLALGLARPDKVIGMHFCSPVHQMSLVEITPGEATSPQTIAKAFDYVSQIGKVPIVVKDGRGSYSWRVFGRYTLEGMALLGEGQHPRAIELAGLQAGMPLGPLANCDNSSLRLAKDIRDQANQDAVAAGKILPQHPGYEVLDYMVDKVGRLGRAYGGGFYEYPTDGKKYLWPELRTHFPLAEPQLAQPELIERLMFVQALEAVRCLEEGVINTSADANIGSVLGWGFAPFKGGVLQYINDYGLPDFVERTQALAESYGARFSVPGLLLTMLAGGEMF